MKLNLKNMQAVSDLPTSASTKKPNYKEPPGVLKNLHLAHQLSSGDDQQWNPQSNCTNTVWEICWDARLP